MCAGIPHETYAILNHLMSQANGSSYGQTASSIPTTLGSSNELNQRRKPMTSNLQEQVREFHNTFRHPTPDSLTSLSVSYRDLRLKLIMEEFLELVKASGFTVVVQPDNQNHNCVVRVEGTTAPTLGRIEFQHVEGSIQDPVEMADGLGDIAYVVYGFAVAMGINLNAVTDEIHDSNMSKLDANGEPILNHCVGTHITPDAWKTCEIPSHMRDQNLPMGKVLKSPNYRKPDIAKVIGLTCDDEGCPHFGRPHAHSVIGL
jgi:predicted HAD superfamily Cof-like phosphohydrolase